MPNFNFIAPVYDQLAFLVFGNNLIAAKKAFFHLVPSSARILLMGGGPGNILNDLLEEKPGTTIDFVEPSNAMIRIAKRNLNEKFLPRVNFICGDHHAIPSGATYDVVTTFFVVDSFKQEDALEFALTITTHLTAKGIWLFADFFDTGKFLDRALLWVMYLFFKVVAGIPASRLPDYRAIFDELSFMVTDEKTFLGNLVRSMALMRK